MALANLKAFVPDLPPSGRRIRQRVLVGGDPGVSKVVEVQLGKRPDRRDFVARELRGAGHHSDARSVRTLTPDQGAAVAVTNR